jgi:hypothetical protein
LSVLAVVPDAAPSKRDRRSAKKNKKKTPDAAAPATSAPTKTADVKPAAERRGAVRSSQALAPSGRQASQRASGPGSRGDRRDPLSGEREEPSP